MSKKPSKCQHHYLPSVCVLGFGFDGVCCERCGDIMFYPKSISYMALLKKISLTMICAWERVGDAYNVLDLDAAKRFFNSFAAGLITLIAILIMPFLFPIYPLIALFAFLNQRRKFRKKAGMRFAALQDIENKKDYQ